MSTLRVDLQGIGDSDGETTAYSQTGNLYTPVLIDQVVAAARRPGGGWPRLPVRGDGIVLGRLLGDFTPALRDERVSACFLVNPRALYWDPLLEPDRAARRMRKVREPAAWGRLLTGKMRPARVRAALRASVTQRKRAANEAERNSKTEAGLERLAAAGRRVLLMFGEGEPLRKELAAGGQLERIALLPNVSLHQLPGHDHTLRPLHAQQRAGRILDEELALEVARQR